MSGDLAGGLAALASAFLFTVAAGLFQRVTRTVPAAGMNLYKGGVAVLALSVVAALRGGQPLPSTAVMQLGLSGLLGITIGDTAYFLALSRLGARRTVLLDTLSPVLTTLLAVVLLRESLHARQALGVALTLAGIVTVMRDRAAPPMADDGLPSWSGWFFAGVSVACHAGGVILSKKGLAAVSSLDATWVRLTCATVALLLVGLAGGRLGAWVRPLRDRRTLGTITAAAFLGTFLAMWLAQAALSLTQASLASTLNATGPIFVLVVARYGLGETISPRAVAGAMLAALGAMTLLA